VPEYQPASHRRPRIFRTGLRTDLPQEDEPSLRTLRLSADGILTRLRATYSGILTSASSTSPHGLASPYHGTLPYHPSSAEFGVRNSELRSGCWPWPNSALHTPNSALERSNASVSGVSPTTLSAQVHIRPVSCYALFQWWLLLSQHPGCLRAPTSFHTEPDWGTLAVGLGCFPFDDEAYPPPSHSLASRRRHSEFG
jgi:hypothetical protein